MALDYPKLLADLRVESDFVIERLTALAEDHWALPTPAQGWSIHDQVSHMAFFDDSTILALSDARQFRSHADELMAAGMDFPGPHCRTTPRHGTRDAAEVVHRLTTAPVERVHGRGS